MDGEFKTGTVHANGLRFTYLETGAGSLVLALHGFPDIPRTFRHQMRALATAGFRVVAPYMRGYFPTASPADASYESAALVQDVLALIDTLAEAPVTLIGHDWGAVAAYGAAVLTPSKVSKLVTIAVPYGDTLRTAFLTNPTQQRRSWYIFFFQMPFAETAVAHNDFEFLERLWQDWSPGWQYPDEEMEAVKATFRKPGVLQAALNYYRHSFNPARHHPTLASIRERLGDPISVPTLYIHGASDGGVGVETTTGMEAAIAGRFQKKVILDGGHFVHQERPDEVNEVILEFLGL
jgi:pimeloyl-ACP methyl ester carboxylesterase